MKWKKAVSILATAALIGGTFAMSSIAVQAGENVQETEKIEDTADLTADELYEKANEARESGDYGVANEYMEAAAEAGHPEAAGRLAEANYNGNFGDPDYERAFRFAEIAEKGGKSKGTLYYGVMLLYGNGTEQNPEAALEAIQKAYDSGEMKAARYLGFAYLNGIGVDPNYELAAEWFEKGTGNGDLTSMVELGKLYMNGDGVEQDYEKAKELFLQTIDGREDHVTAPAMVQLGIMYENGYGVDTDTDAAAQWYLKALRSGLEGDEVAEVEEALEALGTSEEEYKKAEEEASESSGNDGHGGPGNVGDHGNGGGFGNGGDHGNGGSFENGGDHGNGGGFGNGGDHENGGGFGNGDHGNGGGPGGMHMETDPEISAVLDAAAPNFEQFTFEDSETGDTLEYSLFIPDGYSPEESYPLIMFIPDATGAGMSASELPGRYYGAAVWATEEDQEKHPSFVLVPAFTETVVDDDWNTSGQIETAVHLIQSLTEEYSIDVNRLYTTGQSMGCMTSLYLNSTYPDLFAASLFVSGQWDVSVLKALEEEKFFYITAGGDEKASEGQSEVMELFDADDVSYSYGSWDAQASAEEQDAAAEELIAQGYTANMIRFEIGTVLNGGNGMEHMASFNYGYKITAVRDWLFEQNN